MDSMDDLNHRDNASTAGETVTKSESGVSSASLVTSKGESQSQEVAAGDDRLRAFLRFIYVQKYYQLVVAGLISANYIVAIADSSYSDPTQKPVTVFLVFEYLFVILFSIELSINLRVHWFRQFWQNAWNVFDFIVVLLSILALALSSLPGLSVLRLFRVLRIFRLMKALPRLRAIMEGIIASLPNLGYSAVVWLILMGIWAIIGVELFGNGEPDQYGNFLQAMLSCFSLMLYDNIGQNIRQLWITDGYSYALVYCMSFQIVGGIIMWNVVVAILLDKYLEAVRKIEKEIERERAALKAARKRLRLKRLGQIAPTGVANVNEEVEDNMSVQAQQEQQERDAQLTDLAEEILVTKSPSRQEQQDEHDAQLTKMVSVASMRSLASLQPAAAREATSDLPRLLRYTMQKDRSKHLLAGIGKKDLGRLVQYSVEKVLQAGHDVEDADAPDFVGTDSESDLLELAHALHNIPFTGPILQERLMSFVDSRSSSEHRRPAHTRSPTAGEHLATGPSRTTSKAAGRPSLPAAPSEGRSELRRLLHDDADEVPSVPVEPSRRASQAQRPIPLSLRQMGSVGGESTSSPSDTRVTSPGSTRPLSPAAPPYPATSSSRPLSPAAPQATTSSRPLTKLGSLSHSSSLTSIVPPAPIPPITWLPMAISPPSVAGEPVPSLLGSSNRSSAASLYSAVSYSSGRREYSMPGSPLPDADSDKAEPK
eukprot:gnl/Spiro4/17823_TR9480_c0_g1_i1.p1 gnl/Spiro4/17823_TR9480_c0_g1~~gnl/Spiro4/17823_TR9480_c0_g1_i1.p1  ORF type:complete len:745 (+),score=152.64 gnl/Spiro4/17823_TR9480_c0_g1_i1:106-2235(+)